MSDQLDPSLDDLSNLPRAGRNNNPGALKHGPDAAKYGATGYDAQGFAVFPDWYSGARAHGDLLQRHYRGMTIPQMSRHYSPSGHADWARNVMKIGGYKPHDIPNLNDPVELARLQNAIFREQGQSRGKLPRAKPPQAATPMPRPRPEEAPSPQWQPPEPLPGTEGLLPQGGGQPDWYKRMIEHQQRWGYDPLSQQNLPDIINKTGQITDILSNLLPIEKLPLTATRGILGMLRKQPQLPQWQPEGTLYPRVQAPEKTFAKQRDPGKDYDINEIRRRMEQIKKEEPPSPKTQQVLDKGGQRREEFNKQRYFQQRMGLTPEQYRQQFPGHPVPPKRRDYTIEEINAAMRRIMKERGMEP